MKLTNCVLYILSQINDVSNNDLPLRFRDFQDLETSEFCYIYFSNKKPKIGCNIDKFYPSPL